MQISTHPNIISSLYDKYPRITFTDIEEVNCVTSSFSGRFLINTTDELDKT